MKKLKKLLIKEMKHNCKKNKVLKKSGNITKKKRLLVILIFFSIIFCILVIKILWLQFKMGDWLSYMAYQQQTAERSIGAKRGTIYDASGEKILAISSTAQTITVNPVNIKSEDKEKVARAMADIFSLDYEAVYKKISKKSSIETIAKKVDSEQASELRNWLDNNGISTRS